MVWLYHNLLTHSTADGHLGHFWFKNVLEKSFYEHSYWYLLVYIKIVSVGYIPKSLIAELFSSIYLFNFHRYYKHFFEVLVYRFTFLSEI